MASHIISFRDRFYEADDSGINVYPYFPMLAFVATALRSVYRRLRFFVYSLFLNLFIVIFSRSSRLVILQKLHTTDAVEAIKPE